MDWSSYQEKTYKTKPNYLTVNLANHFNFNRVVDLGCGSGNDSVYLLKKGKHVTSIDGSLNKNYILNRINEEEMGRLTLVNSSFEDINIPKCDALISLFSLPFCTPKCFNELWNKINLSLSKGGILVANLFGERDWHYEDDRVVNHTKEEVEELLKNYEIVKWKEQEFTRECDNTHWHFYDFIAIKK